jgi:hydrogenase nickel incorporation protein HypB
MCATCGCSTPSPGGDGAVHDHGAAHGSAVRHRLIELERDVLARNDHLAAHNRDWLTARGVLGINVMSSPGAGKTTLLEATIAALGDRATLAVIEGDQATAHDADRIRAAGVRAIQINTDRTCHLDAAMVGRALGELGPAPGSMLVIENVGNLVCPALFDLGEHARVVVVSVTEGDDKPAKYPHMFRAADVLVLNKIDLLPYVPFDIARCRQLARQVNPRLRILEVSALHGDGIPDWCAWLLARGEAVGAQSPGQPATAA